MFIRTFALIIFIFIKIPALHAGIFLIENLLSEKQVFSGPNCHNNSLRALGLKQFRRHIAEDEMRDFLAQYCTENPTGELGVYHYLTESIPIHSFVYLENNKVFTKDGLSKKKIAWPRITSFSDMDNFHRSTLIRDCERKGITYCELEIKRYKCLKKDISIFHELEKYMHDLYKERAPFFKSSHHIHLLKLVDESLKNLKKDNCLGSQNIYKSLLKSFEAISWNPRGPEELKLIMSLLGNLKKRQFKCPN